MGIHRFWFTWPKPADGSFTLDVSVPPNTSAVVMLPGSDSTTVEVGSGAWNWSVPFTDADIRTIYTLDDRICDVMSDPTACQAVMAVVSGRENMGFFMALFENERGFPLRQALAMIHDDGVLAHAITGALENAGK